MRRGVARGSLDVVSVPGRRTLFPILDETRKARLP